jgi:hypothetical protein
MFKIIIFILILSITTTMSFSNNNRRERAKIYDIQQKDQEWTAYKLRHGKSFRNISHELKRLIF